MRQTAINVPRKRQPTRAGRCCGVLIPKPLLAQVGLEGTADLQVRDGVIEIRAIRRNPREGWADDMNAHLRTVIVAPMTTGSRPARFRVALRFQGKQGLIVLDQIRTLDRVRLVKRMGRLRAPTLALSLQTLQNMFAP